MEHDIIALKKKIKDSIEKLINNGMLNEARKLIMQYEKVIDTDEVIFSFKSIISMVEGNMDEAEEILNEGLLKYGNDKDLLYNIAYLYETIGKFDKAKYFYKRLYHITENINEKKEVEESLKKLQGDVAYRILIGSPVHQKPQILKEFLQSLKELDKKDLIVDFYFVDDNNNNESSNILKKFAIEEKNVFITKSFFNDEYICDNNTHHWKEHLVWKVARFKDNIIKHAKCNNYDYLFLIDSDLVLHPNTLKHLLSTGKDIISEIFWTKWTIDSPELPQVWLSDFYTQYEIARGESLSKTEMLARHQKFINMLKKPGIYEVGGLGACTLISRFALDKGVNFSEIKNLSFWGEDRHFCIRATALGFSLYVDTHYPAYHIYRESDLDGIKNQKKKNAKISSSVFNKTNNFQKRAKITLSMIVKNEADRYLKEVLLNAKRYIDNAVIIDDGSTDSTTDVIKEILKDIPLTLIVNKESRFSNEINLRKQLWEETIKTNPEWIIILDADEMFEDKFAEGVHELVNQDKIDVFCFRLYDFWDEYHYREDKYWNAHLTYRPFLVRYHKDFDYKWKETPLHCGRFPMNILELSTAISEYRVKHYGWANEKDREIKYKRYLELDPDAKYGIKEQYESILDKNPRLIRWIE